MDEHTVTVRFDYDLSEHEDLETFVQDCLIGNRSNAFARDVELVEVVKSESDKE